MFRNDVFLMLENLENSDRSNEVIQRFTSKHYRKDFLAFVYV